MKYLQLAQIDPAGINHGLLLPFGLKADEAADAAQSVHDFLHKMNLAAVAEGYPRFEEMLLGNTFAGMLSELIVVGVSKSSATLARNMQIGGHPDLIPVGAYAGDSVLRGEDGIEVKASKQSSGWQGHNAEASWLLIFQYAIDIVTDPVEDRFPTEIIKVMCAKLELDHWSFSGRNEGSRRTPTASIRKVGTELLHAATVYQRPDYIRNLPKMWTVLSDFER